MNLFQNLEVEINLSFNIWKELSNFLIKLTKLLTKMLNNANKLPLKLKKSAKTKAITPNKNSKYFKRTKTKS